MKTSRVADFFAVALTALIVAASSFVGDAHAQIIQPSNYNPASVAITGGSITGLSSLSISGNETFAGTGRRILGDMTNATMANRLLFQTSTLNSDSHIGVIPNGTSDHAGLEAFNSSDPDNASILHMHATATASQIESIATGTGVVHPLNFVIGPTTFWTMGTGGALQANSTGQRIKGDFNNATRANRLLFQNINTNSPTVVGAIPSGTATASRFTAYSTSDPDNSAIGRVYVDSVDGHTGLDSLSVGTGTTLPLVLEVNNTPYVEVFTSGRVGVNTTTDNGTDQLQVNGTIASSSTVKAAGNLTFTGTGNRITGDFSNATIANRVLLQTSTANNFTSVETIPNGTSTQSQFNAANTSDPTNTSLAQLIAGGADIKLVSGARGTGTFLPLNVLTNGAIQAQFPVAGGFLITQPAGMGYGVGSGGTVTQATSKSTAVTLNKPSGQITMNNALLAGGAAATFTVNDSLVNANDIVYAVLSNFSSANYRLECNVGGGFFDVTITNLTGGNLSDAVVINFIVFKGSIN